MQRSVRVPHRPHADVRTLPGSHAPPSPSQTPGAHTRSAVQKRVSVPQSPHGTVSVAPGVSQGSGGPASTRVPPPPSIASPASPPPPPSSSPQPGTSASATAKPATIHDHLRMEHVMTAESYAHRSRFVLGPPRTL